MSEQALATLLDRTAQFHEAVLDHVGTLAPADDPRHVVAFQAGLLSLEHAAGTIVLVAQGFQSSAYALLRPQFECLVRGVWLLHAANDTWVAKLGQSLTPEGAKQADDMPMLAEMLKQLDKAPDSPRHIVEQLQQYRDTAWKALSSYVHGGLHPLARRESGYPIEITLGVVRNSNGILALTAQLQSILSGDPSNMEPVRRMHVEFADCLPLLTARSQGGAEDRA